MSTPVPPRSMGERVQVVPRRYRFAGANLVFAATGRLLNGHTVECPVCGKGSRRWISLGFAHRLCPHCASFERQRLLVLYIQNEVGLTGEPGRPVRLLHFAPEYGLLRYFPRIPNIDYIPTDLLDPPAGVVRMDITDIPLESASIDLVICSHVLEHVPEDAKAMSELRRVVRPGGHALVLGPVDYSRAATYEDPTIVSPEARHAAFGQTDHVRVYGADFDDRLRAAGFQVASVHYGKQLGEQAVQRYGLQGDDIIYDCS